MAKVKCGYCGKEYDDAYGGALDNGSPACPECVDDEEKRNEEKHTEAQKKKKDSKCEK